MHPHHSSPLITCPKCGQPTASLKQYALCNLLVFVWIMAWTRRATYTSCGPCMRGTILERTLINIIPANLLWVIIVLPWHIVQFCRSYTDGHSGSVAAMLR